MQSLSRSRPARPFWLRTLPLVLLPLMLGLFGLIVWASLDAEGPRFDPAAWRAAQGDEQLRAQRYDVLDDLRQRYLRYGTPRAQVVEWLGEPDARDRLVFSPNESIYELGSSSLFMLDPIYLHVSFDEQDRLLEAIVRGR